MKARGILFDSDDGECGKKVAVTHSNHSHSFLRPPQEATL